MSQKPLVCIGHRGAMGYEPENTLRSLSRAIEMGCDWVEIDVQGVDDQLIVIHDDTLERTTNGKGPIFNQTFTYLRTLDAGKGEQIPTLCEVFDLINCRVGIIIELKGADTEAPVAALIREYLRAGWDRDSIIVSSFDHCQLHRFKELAPHILLGVLMDSIPRNYAADAEEIGAFSINPAFDRIHGDFVTDAHRRKLKVFPYTVNLPADINRMRKLGVDGVFTDYPDRVLRGEIR